MAETKEPPELRRARARVGGLCRDRRPDDPEYRAARIELDVLRRDHAVRGVERHIADLVATAPGITPEQAARLRALLPATRATSSTSSTSASRTAAA